MTILEAIRDPKVFGKLLRKFDLSGWSVLLKAIFGLPMTDPGELRLYREMTGRSRYIPRHMREILVISGRRSGKSFMSALIAVYLAVFEKWPQLAVGERGVVLIISVDRAQSQIVFRYCKGFLKALGRRRIAKETKESIELRNGILIEIRAASYKSVRGYSLLAVICDEISFWRDAETSANPAREILTAVRPSLMGIERSLLIMISTPYDRSGVVYEIFSRNFGHEEAATLVWRSPTRVLNPRFDQAEIDKALLADPISARSEFLAEFRADVESYIPLDVVQALVVPNRAELGWNYRERYTAFLDASSGRSDSFVLAIAHKQGAKAVLDLIREVKAPFDPLRVCADFADVLHSYQIKRVIADNYAVGFIVESFRNLKISVEASPLSASDLYLNFLPILTSGSVELLDNPRLVSQLVGLERRVRTGGSELITHFPSSSSHDDVANAVSGVIVNVMGKSKKLAFFKQYNFTFDPDERPDLNPIRMRNFDPSSLSEEEADELFNRGFRFRR